MAMITPSVRRRSLQIGHDDFLHQDWRGMQVTRKTAFAVDVAKHASDLFGRQAHGAPISSGLKPWFLPYRTRSILS